MKENYEIGTDLQKGDNYVLVSNNLEKNIVYNMGFILKPSNFRNDLVGVWKVKKLD